MTNAEILTMVKVDMGILLSTVYDERLLQKIESAKQRIQKEGITLNLDSIDDCELIAMYACYLWNKRKDGAGMPRMLRYALNNRVISEKGSDDNGW